MKIYKLEKWFGFLQFSIFQNIKLIQCKFLFFITENAEKLKWKESEKISIISIKKSFSCVE